MKTEIDFSQAEAAHLNGEGAEPAAGPSANTARPAEPATTGELMSTARRERGLSLETVARDLNIRREFLAAIEDDDQAALPDAAYAIGFVRSYAKYLNLDAVHAVAGFKAQLDAPAAESELVLPAPVRESRMPVGVLVITALVMAGLAFGSWTLYKQQDAATDTVAATPDKPGSTTADAGAGKTAAAGSATGATPGSRAPKGAKGSGESGASRTESAAGENLTAAGAGASGAAKADPSAKTPAVPKAKTPEKAPKTPATTEQNAAAAPAAAKIYSGPQEVVLRATSNTWIRVRDNANKVLFTRVLRQGDQYRVPKQDGVVVDIGNAGGLDVILNGKVLRPVGPSHMPVYNLSLNPDSLRKRDEAAAAAAAKKAQAARR